MRTLALIVLIAFLAYAIPPAARDAQRQQAAYMEASK
jgi:hypothetical protein